MLDTSIKVKTDSFDGPLALLLLLVQRQEMDIRQLDLTVITQQYLSYLSKMKELNFDVAGDYLYFAATLLLLKSKSCLSEEEKTESLDSEINLSSQEELIGRLETLAHFQRMGGQLWALPKKGHQVFVRPKVNRREIVNSFTLSSELDKLTQAFMDFLRKERRKFTVERKERISLREKMIHLKKFFNVGESLSFQEILEKDGDLSNNNLVVTFISLLELARLRKVNFFQSEQRGSALYRHFRVPRWIFRVKERVSYGRKKRT